MGKPLHSQKHHRLGASYGFDQPTSYIKPVYFIKLFQLSENQTCCNLMKQLASSLHAVHNLQQVG